MMKKGAHLNFAMGTILHRYATAIKHRIEEGKTRRMNFADFRRIGLEKGSSNYGSRTKNRPAKPFHLDTKTFCQ